MAATNNLFYGFQFGRKPAKITVKNSFNGIVSVPVSIVYPLIMDNRSRQIKNDNKSSANNYAESECE